MAFGLCHDIAQGRNKLAEHLLGPVGAPHISRNAADGEF